MFTRHYRELLHFLGRSVQDRHTAADLAQESYARVLAAQKSGEDIADPRALLFRTARNLLIDRHRHHQVRRAAHGEAVQDGEDDDDALALLAAPAAFEPEVAVASQQSVHALLATIGALPVRCRQAFMLHKFEGLSHAEVAERMGITVKMVEKHIKLGLQACRDCLAQQGQASVPGASPRAGP